MTKLLRTLSLILIILMLFTSVACTPIDHDNGNNGDNGGSGGNTDVDIKLPDMEIPEGYTVLSSKELTLPVTHKEQTTDHKARIAAIKHENGENALYLDVISKDNTVLLTKVWYGYYQLYISDTGLLSALNISASSALSGSISFYSYHISDFKISSTGSTEQYDAPKLIPSTGSNGGNQKFNLENAMQIDLCKGNCEILLNKLRSEIKDNTSLFMIADCYLAPSDPKLYSPADKTPVPTQQEIAAKYDFNYLLTLFSVN